jgi:hypothetical protein
MDGWGYIQGHPQCLKNVITVGLASLFGKGSSEVDGAFSPILGGSETSTGEGENQEGYSWNIEPILLCLIFFVVTLTGRELIYGVLEHSHLIRTGLC